MRWFVIAFMCCCGMVNAGTLPTVVVPPKQGVFEVVLPANPTTGFQWALVAYDKKTLKLLGQKYHAPATKRMGAGGKAVFYFQCNSIHTLPKRTLLKFVYRRPWEKQVGKKTTVAVVFER